MPDPTALGPRAPDRRVRLRRRRPVGAARDPARATPGNASTMSPIRAMRPTATKSIDYIEARSRHIIGFLQQQGVKAVVVACNTVTGLAIRHLRATFPDLPIVAIEPAVKPAAQRKARAAVGDARHQADRRESRTGQAGREPRQWPSGPARRPARAGSNASSAALPGYSPTPAARWRSMSSRCWTKGAGNAGAGLHPHCPSGIP